jgi:hypothetical protein
MASDHAIGRWTTVVLHGVISNRIGSIGRKRHATWLKRAIEIGGCKRLWDFH